MKKRYKKQDRQRFLSELIRENPFMTDKELAEYFQVSVQTIRLDRLEMGIPEVRERTRNYAHNAYERLKSVTEGEVIGDLVKLELDQYAESYLLTDEKMALKKSKIIRGHHIFAQANSLAVAAIDAESVLTGSVEIKFLLPVHVGETLRARADVLTNEGNKRTVKVRVFKEDSLVFTGDFIMFTRKESEI